MARYSLKTYDRSNGLLETFDFSAPNDDQAVAAVPELGIEEAHELWCGKRWIRTWPSRDQAA